MCKIAFADVRTVSADVLNLLDKETSPEDLLKGRTNLAAILFYDIRGFSLAAETLPPQALLSALNDHLQLITLVRFLAFRILNAYFLPPAVPHV